MYSSVLYSAVLLCILKRCAIVHVSVILLLPSVFI